MGHDAVSPAPLTAEEFHPLAERVLPRAVLDYVDGGTEDERSLQWNRDAFQRWAYLPTALVDVDAVDPAATVLGQRLAAPFGFSPTGYTRMMHPEGELAVARAAAAAGIPYCFSTMATATIEDAAAASGIAPWSQLYPVKDRGITIDLIDRAAAVGSPVLVVTTDSHRSSNRLRDTRSGLTIPPAPDSDPEQEAHRGYWDALAALGGVDYAQLAASAGAATGLRGGNAAGLTRIFDSTLDWAAIDAIRDRWPGRLLVKGPYGAADVRRAAEHGLDGVWLSNHGGRQLDRVVPPLDLVAEARAAMPDGTIIVDGGVRSGSDVALAIALGADAAFLGRPYVWALAADGEAGVRRLLDILLEEFVRTIGLLGAPDVAALRRLGTAVLRRRD